MPEVPAVPGGLTAAGLQTAVADAFAPGGPIAEALPGFEARQGQLDMAEAVREVVAVFTGNPALDRRIEVCAEPVCVDGDAVRLEQVFANIVSNAIKYTPPGGVIRVSVRSDADLTALYEAAK